MDNKFKLHSHSVNWFHFRKDLNSIMESFSITYCHDGTVVMTGDYGCLIWRREYFPKKPDYGFPSKDTWIGYFAEKVVRAENEQNITGWKKELAIKDIKEDLERYKEDGFIEASVVLCRILDELDYIENEGEYGYIQMLEAFSDTNTCLESETFVKYGRDYTDEFKSKFEKLQSVSDIILEVVNREYT